MVIVPVAATICRALEEQALSLFPFLSAADLLWFGLVHSKTSFPRTTSVTSRAFGCTPSTYAVLLELEAGVPRGVQGHAYSLLFLLLTSCAPS